MADRKDGATLAAEKIREIALTLVGGDAKLVSDAVLETANRLFHTYGSTGRYDDEGED